MRFRLFRASAITTTQRPIRVAVGLEPGGGYPILRLGRGEPIVFQLFDKFTMGEALIAEVIVCGAHGVLWSDAKRARCTQASTHT